MELDDILQKWDNAKKLKLKYEKDCDIYKSSIEIYMNKKKLDVVHGTDFIVTQRHTTRKQLLKKSVSKEIWDKYSKLITYTTYYLKRNKK